MNKLMENYGAFSSLEVPQAAVDTSDALLLFLGL